MERSSCGVCVGKAFFRMQRLGEGRQHKEQAINETTQDNKSRPDHAHPHSLYHSLRLIVILLKKCYGVFRCSLFSDFGVLLTCMKNTRKFITVRMISKTGSEFLCVRNRANLCFHRL